MVGASNGTPLAEGDAVALIKELEGRANGITIVLKTQFLKKA